MKTILGLLLILGGLAAGLYVGVWLMLIGGIVDIVNQIKAPDTNALALAIGVAKIVFAGAVGWLAGIVPALFGFALIQDA